jgi:hypothetical protein
MGKVSRGGVGARKTGSQSMLVHKALGLKLLLLLL